MTDFLEIKTLIDAEVEPLNWSKSFCKEYIIAKYGKISRRVMTDEQLQDFLATLKSVKTPVKTARGRSRRLRREQILKE